MEPSLSPPSSHLFERCRSSTRSGSISGIPGTGNSAASDSSDFPALSVPLSSSSCSCTTCSTRGSLPLSPCDLLGSATLPNHPSGRSSSEELQRQSLPHACLSSFPRPDETSQEVQQAADCEGRSVHAISMEPRVYSLCILAS